MQEMQQPVQQVGEPVQCQRRSMGPGDGQSGQFGSVQAATQQGRQQQGQLQQQGQEQGQQGQGQQGQRQGQGQQGQGQGQQHGQQGQQQGQQEQPHPHSWHTPPHLITGSIQSAYQLGHLQQVLAEHDAHLSPIHLSALLQRAVELASSEPDTWFRIKPRGADRSAWPRSPSGKWPSQYPPPKWARTSGGGGSSFDDSEQHPEDWGMSDEGVLPSPQERRQKPKVSKQQAAPSPPPLVSQKPTPPPLTELGKQWALQQLKCLVHRVAKRAAKLAQQHQELDSVAASLMISALAKLGYSDPDVLQAILQASIPHLPKAGLRQLTILVWACAMLKLHPGRPWFAAWEQGLAAHIMRSPSNELATCVYALGVLQHRPSSRILRAACVRSQQILLTFRPLDIANFCAGLAGMRHLPEDTWIAELLATTAPKLRTFQLRQLHRVLTSLASLGCKPDNDWWVTDLGH